MTDFQQSGADNLVEIGANIILSGWLQGNRNRIVIADAKAPQKIHVQMNGDDNLVWIGARATLNGLRIECGNQRYASSRSSLTIGAGFSAASSCRFLLPNSGNRIEIGENCMFSNQIVLRGGEYPHLVFDNETGAYLDISDGIFIGDHVWVGEGAYINKSVTIPSDCIIGARSVVTKRFTKTHAVIAGNPARVVKENVRWVGNDRMLSLDSPEYASLQAARAQVANRPLPHEDPSGPNFQKPFQSTEIP